MRRSQHTLETARDAAARDELAAWVAEFLASPGSDNAPLAAKLTDRDRCWIGPLELPIDRLHRLAGPPDQPVLVPTDEEEWPERVEQMEELVEDGWEPPPVIVTYRDGQLVLEDGNHRVESLRRADVHEAWAVIGFEDPAERDAFLADAMPDPATS